MVHSARDPDLGREVTLNVIAHEADASSLERSFARRRPPPPSTPEHRHGRAVVDIAQRNHRIDGRRAPCRQVQHSEGNDAEHEGDGCERQRIVDVLSNSVARKSLVAEMAPAAPTAETNRYERHPLAHRATKHAAWLRTKSHTYSNLTPPLRHGECEHTVQADRCEQQCDDAEAGDHQGAEALRRRPITLKLIDRCTCERASAGSSAAMAIRALVANDNASCSARTPITMRRP